MDPSSQVRVLAFQGVGFLTIVALSWLNEALGLTALIFENNTYLSNFNECALEMVLVLAVWLLVSGSTRRLVRHVEHLEGFQRVCAWCRRIDHKGKWMPLEEFLQEGFDTPTTHGICHECLSKQQVAQERARRARLKEARSAP